MQTSLLSIVSFNNAMCNSNNNILKKKLGFFFLSFNVLNEWAPLAHMMHTRYIQIEGRKETETEKSRSAFGKWFVVGWVCEFADFFISGYNISTNINYACNKWSESSLQSANKKSLFVLCI